MSGGPKVLDTTPAYHILRAPDPKMTLSHLNAPDAPLAIIGLGYVGLPLAVEFGLRLRFRG